MHKSMQQQQQKNYLKNTAQVTWVPDELSTFTQFQ